MNLCSLICLMSSGLVFCVCVWNFLSEYCVIFPSPLYVSPSSLWVSPSPLFPPSPPVCFYFLNELSLNPFQVKSLHGGVNCGWYAHLLQSCCDLHKGKKMVKGDDCSLWRIFLKLSLVRSTAVYSFCLCFFVWHWFGCNTCFCNALVGSRLDYHHNYWSFMIFKWNSLPPCVPHFLDFLYSQKSRLDYHHN